MHKRLSFCAALALAGLLWRCSPSVSLEGLALPVDPVSVARGRELVRGLGACGFCHGQSAEPNAPLSGGRPAYDAYGEVIAPNLTPAAGALDGWSPLELLRAIRYAVDKNGSPRSPEVHRGFEWLADNDALAVAAYLKTLPAVENIPPRRSVSFVDRNTTGLLLGSASEVGYVPEIDRRFEVQYGGYLTDHVARCIQCHNSPATVLTSEEYLVGGTTVRSEKGLKVAPGITNSDTQGIGSWSEDDVVHYLKTGRSPQGQTSDTDFCPTHFYRNAPERDLRAVAKYLKSLPK